MKAAQKKWKDEMVFKKKMETSVEVRLLVINFIFIILVVGSKDACRNC